MTRDGPKTFDEIRSSLQGLNFNAAIAHAKKNGWINIEKTDTGSMVSMSVGDWREITTPSEEEMTISAIGEKTVPSEYIEHQTALKSLMGRPDFLIEHKEKIKTVSLSETGKNIDLEKLDSDAIDVEADVPHVHAARIHPLKDTINEIRETFVHLGFTEITGNLS